MKKYHLGIAALILVIMFVILLLLNSNHNQKEMLKVCIKDNCFVVEIAQTQEEKVQGLMHRVSLDNNKGMLFIYDSPTIAKFWMKNTLISLDIIWINKNNKIVHIEKAF